MALITTVAPERAEGVVKEGYDMFVKNIGTIPQPMQMLSVSPALFGQQLQRIQYFSRHPRLSFALLAHIRYLAACTRDFTYCMDLNRHFLKKVGYDDAGIRAMEEDPSRSMLEEKEGILLEFVIRAIKEPAAVGAADIARLREHGWHDQDMVEALAQGVGMLDHAIMMQVFQIDQQCLV